MTTTRVDDGFWQSLEGVLTRTSLVAQSYVSTAYNGIVALLSKNQVANVDWLIADDDACEECKSYAGTYDPVYDYIPDIPVHPYCRCWLENA